MKTKLKLGRILILLSLLAPLLMGADQGRLITVTFVNKSDFPLGIRMVGAGSATFKNTYYFTVPEGTRSDPFTKSFEIMPDKYTITVNYTQFWDPVYGYDCGVGATSFTLRKDTRITFLKCGLHPRYRGETGQLKFNQFPYRHPDAEK